MYKKNNKKEICIFNNNIYILNKTDSEYESGHYFCNIRLSILDITKGHLNIIQQYEEIKIYEDNPKFFCLNEGDIVLWGNKLYILKEKKINLKI